MIQFIHLLKELTYEVETARVGQNDNYDKLIYEVELMVLLNQKKL